MVDFILFMLKCIWHGSTYVFASSTTVDPSEPFHSIGLVGWYIFVISFGISGWFVLKVIKKHTLFYQELILSILIALIPVVIYYMIAYCFV